MKRIITITLNPAIDKIASVAHVVAEHKLYCTQPRFEPGGGGVNVSRAIRKLGGKSLLIYPAGTLTGKRIQELLDEDEIDHRPLPINGMTRESLVILEDPPVAIPFRDAGTKAPEKGMGEMSSGAVSDGASNGLCGG